MKEALSLLVLVLVPSFLFANEHAVSNPAPAIQPPTTINKTAHDGTDPDKALLWLKNGNIRFRKGSLRKDGQAAADREKLSTGQKPHTIILSCSDSRVPPEIVFDQKLGEIFVVRTAGESVDSSVLASLEYAVEHLGTRLILVLAHESCGAVMAAIDTPVGKSAGSPHIDKMIAEIQSRLKMFSAQPKSKNIHSESIANAKGVALDLLKRSEILRHASESGEIKVQTAIYHLDNGTVDFSE
jgi:carbonic anhydrase